MKCARCGGELAPGGQFCGSCGAPRSELPQPFAEAERRFTELRDRYQRGEMDDAAYEEALRELIVLDGEGRYWMLGTESGVWYCYEGEQWIRQDPSLEVAPAPSAPPARPGVAVPAAAPAAPAARPRRGSPWKWIAIFLATLLILVAAVVVVAWRFPSLLPFDLGLPVAAAPTPTATLPPPPTPTEAPTVAEATPTPMPIVAATAEPTSTPTTTPVPTETPPPVYRLYFPLFWR